MHAETVEMSDLYDTDAMGWSEHQADLLRRHAAGERANNPGRANRPLSIERASRTVRRSANRGS